LTTLSRHPGFQEVLMPKPSQTKNGQLNLFQISLPSPALPREVNQKTVILLARMLREHTGRFERVEKAAAHE
jgi:hypothetical protein